MHTPLQPGSAIEVHFVRSTAHVAPRPTLAACLSKENGNPQLRVETVVAVRVNDPGAADLIKMTALASVIGSSGESNIPDNLVRPVDYSGSTTGPDRNAVLSLLQVTWNVRPQVDKANAASENEWLESNPFKEDHAHGVRNLVIDPPLFSPIFRGMSLRRIAQVKVTISSGCLIPRSVTQQPWLFQSRRGAWSRSQVRALGPEPAQ